PNAASSSSATMRSMVSRTRSRITRSMVSAPTSRPSPGSRFLLSLPMASSSGTRCPAGAVVGQLRRMMTPSFHFSTTRPTLPVSTGDQLRMTTSTDGGLTWSEAAVPSMGAAGGQPVVQRNGTVIVPLGDAYLSSVRAVTSTDGGLSYAGPVTIAPILAHPVAGNLRSPPLPSAEIDEAGRVYVVWQDCRFRSGCASNDIVMSTSSNGTAWSPVVRIPIDDTTSAVDHFIPGLAVDKATAGSS